MINRIASPEGAREIMKKHGLRIQKKLGQNFLLDQQVVDRIVDGAEVGPEDLVLEVGPGIGALTQALAERAGRVIAIELDRQLIPVLQEVLEGFPQVEIHQGDALAMDLTALTEPYLKEGQGFKVVANLPYYITTPLIMHFLESRLRLHSLTVMVQKEVAERMAASPGGKDYGALTVAVQYYCTARIVCKVPPGSFLPPPAVDSAVINLTLRDKPAVEVADERFFFRVVKAAFGMRRKTLSNALGALGLAYGKEEINRRLTEIGIDPGRRGETLSLEEFARLSEKLADSEA